MRQAKKIDIDNYAMATQKSIALARLDVARYQQERALTELVTGLHPNDIGSNIWELVEAQRKKIQGLRTHMASMGRGYGRKIKRLEKKLEIALAASDLSVEELEAGFQKAMQEKRRAKARSVVGGGSGGSPSVLPAGANGAAGGPGSAI
jgi:hypothetical protein